MAGVLEDIVAAEGSTVGVDALLAVVAEVKAAAAQPASAPAKDTSTPAAAEPAAPAAPATPAPAAPSAPATGATMTLSPAVRKLVEEHQLNPAAIRATGKDGRLTKADVKAAIDNDGARNAAAPASAAPVSAPAVARPNDPREERVPMSRLRRIIASRLKDAQNTAAMLTTFNEVDMSAVMALRSEYKDEFEKNHGARLGFMGFFVKAVITALTEFPAVNAEIHGDDIIYKNFYNIGVAVGTPQGLVVPVLKDAQHMGLADIESLSLIHI